MEIKNPKYHKNITIYRWKSYGVIYHDFDDLYEVYIKTMNCSHCNKEFTSTSERQLDHNHETGAFRAIVCRACNLNDSYIKYPNGFDVKKYKKDYEQRTRERDREYYKHYKQEYYNKRKNELKEKITCLCGMIIARGSMNDHLKKSRHLNNMDKYMENVD